MFGGGATQQADPVDSSYNTTAQQQQQQQPYENNCAGVTKQFTTCLDEHSGNMQICGWYLEQLVRRKCRYL